MIRKSSGPHATSRQGQRLGLADEEADGHQLQAVALDGLPHDRAALLSRSSEQPALTDL
jgi:hypothetical protein